MLKDIVGRISRAVRGSKTGSEDKTAEGSHDSGAIERMQAHGGSQGPLYFRGFLGETRGVWNEYGFNLGEPVEAPETTAPERVAPAAVEGVLEDALTDVPLITAILKHLDSSDYEDDKSIKTKPKKPMNPSVPI
jgi:hypothetical protein